MEEGGGEVFLWTCAGEYACGYGFGCGCECGCRCVHMCVGMCRVMGVNMGMWVCVSACVRVCIWVGEMGSGQLDCVQGMSPRHCGEMWITSLL